jgi:hypothetical protein
MASAGVAIRFWSPLSLPSGRTPGVTISFPGASGMDRIIAASCGEAMTPSAPASSARAARVATISGTAPSRISAASRSARSSEVRTVTARIFSELPEAPFARGAHNMRVAVHGQEIEIELREAAHRRLDRGGDVEELHVEEDALAMLGLELVRQREAAARQHPEPDLVERDGLVEPVGEREALECIRHVEGDDQAVVEHWLTSGFGRSRLLSGGAAAVKAARRPCLPRLCRSPSCCGPGGKARAASLSVLRLHVRPVGAGLRVGRRERDGPRHAQKDARDDDGMPNVPHLPHISLLLRRLW